MLVRELIAKLQEQDPEAKVVTVEHPGLYSEVDAAHTTHLNIRVDGYYQLDLKYGVPMVAIS